ncbi:MAG: hypothetical protein ABIW02_00275 [Nitrosospira sp.]
MLRYWCLLVRENVKNKHIPSGYFELPSPLGIVPQTTEAWT